MTDETLKERDARLNAWLENVKPGDIVTVRLNSTDTLTGKVYEVQDARGTSLCVWTTVLRHGNGYPGGSYDLVPEAVNLWLPTRWWRVVGADGELWMETSDEEEARNGLRESHIDEDEDLVYGEVVPGRKLQRLYETLPTSEWKDDA